MHKHDKFEVTCHTLLHHTDLNAQELFLAPVPKKATKTRRIWCIKQTKELLGPKVCDNILFIHAILGCDSMSRLFGMGKGMAPKKVKNDTSFLGQAKCGKRHYHCSR